MLHPRHVATLGSEDAIIFARAGWDLHRVGPVFWNIMYPELYAHWPWVYHHGRTNNTGHSGKRYSPYPKSAAWSVCRQCWSSSLQTPLQWSNHGLAETSCLWIGAASKTYRLLHWISNGHGLTAWNWNIFLRRLSSQACRSLSSLAIQRVLNEDQAHFLELGQFTGQLSIKNALLFILCHDYDRLSMDALKPIKRIRSHDLPWQTANECTETN